MLQSIVCRISFCENKQSFYKTLILRTDTMGTFQLGILLAFKPIFFYEFHVFSLTSINRFSKVFGLKFDVSASLGRGDTSAVDYWMTL